MGQFNNCMVVLCVCVCAHLHSSYLGWQNSRCTTLVQTEISKTIGQITLIYKLPCLQMINPTAVSDHRTPA